MIKLTNILLILVLCWVTPAYAIIETNTNKSIVITAVEEEIKAAEYHEQIECVVDLDQILEDADVFIYDKRRFNSIEEVVLYAILERNPD